MDYGDSDAYDARSAHRHWCFTYNNPTHVPTPDEWPDCHYAIYQLEMGASGTVHYQGYAEFSKSKRLSWLRNHTNMPGAHWAVRRGTREEARNYCMKPERFVTIQDFRLAHEQYLDLTLGDIEFEDPHLDLIRAVHANNH